MNRPQAIDPDGWYTLGQAAKVLPYSVGQLRARVKLGQIKHEVNPPLREGGRITYKVPGHEVLRLLGKAVTDAQPRERVEPIAARVKRCLEWQAAQKQAKPRR